MASGRRSGSNASGAGTRRWLSIAISIALGLLTSEGLVRLFARVSGPRGERLARFDPLLVRYVPHGDFGYRQRPNSTELFSSGASAHANSMGYRGPLVSPAKPSGVYRIVLLGESTTQGWGVDDNETIDEYMREMLRARYPDRPIEVVNLALGGYDSYQIFERMRSDGVPLSPDLVILNSGINDVRNAKVSDLRTPGPDPRTLIWEAHMSLLREQARLGRPPLWSVVRHHSYLARLPGFLRELLGERDRVKQILTVRPKSDAIDYFAANLRRTADLAEGIHAGLVLSTPPSALASYETSATSHLDYWVIDAATTEEYRGRLARRMRQLAAELEAEGRRVTYVQHHLAPDLFLDDCHLRPAGNRAVAASFVEAAAPFIETATGAAGTRTDAGKPRPTR